MTATYDLSGRLKSLGYPSGLSLSYTHDGIGRVTAVNDGANDRVADTYKGWLLEKRTYASDAYLTHLDDNGENLSAYGETTHWTRMYTDKDGWKTTRRAGPGQQKARGA